MPHVDAGRLSLGWGCSCPSFKMGNPSPRTAYRAALKAVDEKYPVQVLYQGIDDDGVISFAAWSKETRYAVVLAPDSSGGFCKHTLACAAELGGAFWRSLFEGVKRQEEAWKKQMQELKQENRKLSRENQKLKKLRSSSL
jgi:hypothetical protein